MIDIKEYDIMMAIAPYEFLFNQKLTPLVSQNSLENKQGQSPVGRDVLFPTSVYITNKFHRSIEALYANIFCSYRLFLYADLRRDEDIPTYRSLILSARFYFMRILLKGALKTAPYGFLLNPKSYMDIMVKSFNKHTTKREKQ